MFSKPVAYDGSYVSWACHACGRPDSRFRCAQCKEVWYCSQSCQKDHWQLHKQLCAKPKLHKEEQEVLTLAAEMGIGTEVPVCDPTRLYIAALTFRNGVSLFMETLEYTHYAPGSLRATEFQCWFIPFLGYCVAVCSIPLGDMEWAKQAAHKTGMKICAGTFEISGPEGRCVFPLFATNNNVFHLENGACSITTDTPEEQREKFLSSMRGRETKPLEKPKTPGPVMLDLPHLSKK